MATEERNPQISRRRFLTWGAAIAASAGLAPLLAAGCGGSAAPAATAAPTKAPAAASTSAPAAGAATSQPAVAPTYTLKFTHHEPANSKFAVAIDKWANEVNQKTGGKVKIQTYPAETLAKGTDAFPAVQNGIADMGWVIVAFFPGRFPLTEAYSMPVLGVKSSSTGAQALWDLYSQNQEVQKEWSAVHLVGFTSSGPQFIATSKKPVRTMDDVKGLKLRVAGFGGTALFKNLGASPINMAPPDFYDSLSKGVLDGIVFDWQGINSSRLYEVLNYASTMPVIMQPQAVIMNSAKWNSLPPDIQKVITDLGGKYLGKFVGTDAFDAADAEGVDNFKKLNKEIITFSADEQKKWSDAAKPVWKDWVASVQGKGDGQKALDQLVAAIADEQK